VPGIHGGGGAKVGSGTRIGGCGELGSVDYVDGGGACSSRVNGQLMETTEFHRIGGFSVAPATGLGRVTMDP